MNLPITHLAIVCIVVSSDGREKGKDWASYHPYHHYLIKNFGCFLSLTLGLLLLFFFLTNMKSLALASQNIDAWLFVLSFFLISQYAQNLTMSKHKQTSKQNKTTVYRKVPINVSFLSELARARLRRPRVP